MGFHLPEQVVTNQDLMAIMDTSDEWIQARSGIQERRWVTEDEAASDLAIPASKKAMDMAGVAPEDIDLVIVATLSADYFFPGVSSQLQDKLGLRTVAAFDIKAACSAFVYGLSIADQYIRSGTCHTVLVVGTEAQTKFINKTTEGGMWPYYLVMVLVQQFGRDSAVLVHDSACGLLYEQGPPD